MISLLLGQQRTCIDWRPFVLRLPFCLARYGEAGYAVKAIIGIFSGSANQQILLFINHIMSLIFAHLEIRSELNGVGWTCFFTKPTKNAARKIDPEIFRVPPSSVFSFLKTDAIDRACDGAEIAGYATLFAIRITREHDTATVTRCKIWHLFRILHCLAAMKQMKECNPECPYRTQHLKV